MSPHSWAVELSLLGLICIIGITLGLVAHRQTQPPPKPDIAPLCEVRPNWDPRGELIDGMYYIPGWSNIPCRWQHLEQDV